MNPRNFWELLREKYSELTRSGRLVADYLTQHAEQAQYLSISALGAACGVAEATIFRFCRSLGFDGYNEMKIALAQANAMPNAEAGAVSVDAINGTLGVLDPAAVDEAAALLEQARQEHRKRIGKGYICPIPPRRPPRNHPARPPVNTYLCFFHSFASTAAAFPYQSAVGCQPAAYTMRTRTL